MTSHLDTYFSTILERRSQGARLAADLVFDNARSPLSFRKQLSTVTMEVPLVEEYDENDDDPFNGHDSGNSFLDERPSISLGEFLESRWDTTSRDDQPVQRPSSKDRPPKSGSNRSASSSGSHHKSVSSFGSNISSPKMRASKNLTSVLSSPSPRSNSKSFSSLPDALKKLPYDARDPFPSSDAMKDLVSVSSSSTSSTSVSRRSTSSLIPKSPKLTKSPRSQSLRVDRIQEHCKSINLVF